MGLIADRDAALNRALTHGRLFEVFRQVYHPRVVMFENEDLAAEGIEANLQREKRFYASIRELRRFEVLRSAVDEAEQVSFAEMTLDCVLQDGRHMVLHEVAVRQWRDGQIVREQFFYKP